MAEAMEMVRLELGDAAIIVSTQRAAGQRGVRVTAAQESADADLMLTEMLGQDGASAVVETIRSALVSHSLPTRLVERLVNAARTTDINDATLACAAALESGFSFAPLPEHSAPRPFMMVGPPGSGKSMAIAKLAARSVLKQRHVGVITCDHVRAGAVEQLAAFTRILEIELVKVRSAEDLHRTVEEQAGLYDLLLIDSPGLNPFKTTDLGYLRSMVEAANVEPILLMAAGMDPLEAAEMAEAFGSVGATRLFTARLDTTRRLGGMFTAAEAGQLALCDVSSSPNVASGISPLSALSLARLLIPQPTSKSPVNDFHGTHEAYTQ